MKPSEARGIAEIILTENGENYDDFTIDDAIEGCLGRRASDLEYSMVATALETAEVTVTFKEVSG